MSLDKATLRRLAFIRYMYQLGADQSRQPEPYSAVSVLTFHDAVELFLQLAAEHLNVSTNNDIGFMAYWERLEQKLGGEGLSQKQAMARVNKARVGLKHSGIRPSKEDIVGYRVSVANFFLENTPTVFGMEFADATLINFVKPDSARQRLMQARTSREEGNLVERDRSGDDRVLRGSGRAFGADRTGTLGQGLAIETEDAQGTGADRPSRPRGFATVGSHDRHG